MSNSDFNKPEIPALGIVADLDEADRGLLSGYGEFLPVHDGNDLITEGDPQDSLYFVISGILHAHSEKDGKRTLIGRIEAGETIGEVSIFDPGPDSANVTAQGFCQVWRANRDDITAFLEAYPQPAGRFLIGIVAEMSRRIRSVNQKLSTAELETSIQNFFH